MRNRQQFHVDKLVKLGWGEPVYAFGRIDLTLNNKLSACVYSSGNVYLLGGFRRANWMICKNCKVRGKGKKRRYSCKDCDGDGGEFEVYPPNKIQLDIIYS